ncbi:hypothetical protein [Paenibacillus segetis]|nr:hypothetical protein [Paenibacillus segetis]
MLFCRYTIVILPPAYPVTVEAKAEEESLVYAVTGIESPVATLHAVIE